MRRALFHIRKGHHHEDRNHLETSVQLGRHRPNPVTLAVYKKTGGSGIVDLAM
jgi:hypothetical protein